VTPAEARGDDAARDELRTGGASLCSV
jgi:hypothetical protein